ncbi:hypothetical protein [Rhizohabitans arisaemae]|uniref:hypothetical protein n=1 Tax=Rhizohabitans arisaemae TaxID=2720610 RepID=UPI0024B07DB5|nr:hypothetical protein [Rhizohabitans arisaemae]
MKSISTLSDRILGLFAPKGEAQASQPHCMYRSCGAMRRAWCCRYPDSSTYICLPCQPY